MKQRLLAVAALMIFTGAAWAGPAATGGIAVDDSIITAKIKSALVEEAATKAREIKVKTLHGVVQLSGSVDSLESRQRAEVIASTTEGVSSVRNKLKVRAAANSPGK